MATYFPPKRATEYIFYVTLKQQADTKLLQTAPTLAAGDFTISKDGGAFANLASLPTVTPAGGVGVKIVLSATEMTADNVLVVAADAAGAEWCSDSWNLQTTATQLDNLVRSTTPANTLAVDASGYITFNNIAGVQQNTPLPAFSFYMLDSSTHCTAATGLAVTAERSIDGAAFGACTNGVVELSDGVYSIDLAAADLNGDVIVLKFTAVGGDDCVLTLRTTT